MASIHEILTEQFYRWESRGRGWQVFDQPVSPEPPFLPFHGHYQSDTPSIDDGRRPTFISSFIQRLSRKLAPPPTQPTVIPTLEDEPEPQVLIRDQLVELQASLATNLNIPKEAFEQFFLNLSLCREPIAFELLGLPQRITAQFAASAEDAPLVKRQLQAYFPEAVFETVEGALEAAWEASEGDDALAVEFGL